MTAINKAAVIGAGVMGASIAAHLTNAGVPVILLDIVAEEVDDRSKIAKDALERLTKADPAAFMDNRNAALITVGNSEDDLDLLADCDWIIEAVIERLDVKQGLYTKIEAARKPGSIISSNTSTIPLTALISGMTESFASDFLIAHFFNPPRYMRLLELVVGEKTRPEAAASVRAFADEQLGKTVVDCKNTPGFIANRIGTFWLQCAVVETIKAGASIELSDAVLGRPAGVPKTGVFGLLDLVGLDLMPLVLRSLVEALPKNDPLQDIYSEPEVIQKMIDDGYTGRKGKGGFYRLDTSSGKRVKEAIDLATGAYSPAQKPQLRSLSAAKKNGLLALITHPDAGGRLARRVLTQTLAYAASLVPEIADDIVAVDAAMHLGYNWNYGPFQLIDQIGTENFAELLETDGMPVPRLLGIAAGRPFYRVEAGQQQYLSTDGEYCDVIRPAGVVLLEDVRRDKAPVARNRSASLWDIGDEVLCLEFHSKMNSLNPLILRMIEKAIRIIPNRYRALVIYNEGSNFSVGANIGLLLVAMKFRAWFAVRYLVKQGQQVYAALKYAPFPVVGAPSGMALGGGCEILLHCDAVQAHAETYTGLVEVGVGIIPGWGGCKELLSRWVANREQPGGPMPPVVKTFETVSTAKVAKSAAEAKDLLFLRPDDGITMNRDRVLADAKTKALSLADDYVPPQPSGVSLPGPTARLAMEMAVDGFRQLGKATAHDVVVSNGLARVLSGGDTDITESISEQELLALERDVFVSLAKHSGSIARVAHMIKTGKPLRN